MVYMLKLLPVASLSHVGPDPELSAPLMVQNPANTPGKTAEVEPSAWAATSTEEIRLKLLAPGCGLAQFSLCWYLKSEKQMEDICLSLSLTVPLTFK